MQKNKKIYLPKLQNKKYMMVQQNSSYRWDREEKDIIKFAKPQE